MKIRDSGMPEQEYWETLFDAQEIVKSFGWKSPEFDRNQHVIEFGCGYGTFTESLADCFFGRVDGFDIDASMIDATRKRLSNRPRDHVHLHQVDFVSGKIPDATKEADLAVLFHMMHLNDPMDFLRRVASCIRPGGSLAILHWRSDHPTPRGPAMDTRPTPKDIHNWSAQLEAISVTNIEISHSPHHYAVLIALP